MIKPRTAPGFTILEVLVVLVIIGIISSFAILSVGRGSNERLTEEGQRLAALITLQQQEALLTGEVRGIQFMPNAYALYRRDAQNRWNILQTVDYLVSRTLPADLELQLWIEQRRVALENAAFPQLLLLNNGEATPFTLIFSTTDNQLLGAAQYRISGDALGRLSVGTVDNAYN